MLLRASTSLHWPCRSPPFLYSDIVSPPPLPDILLPGFSFPLTIYCLWAPPFPLPNPSPHSYSQGTRHPFPILTYPYPPSLSFPSSSTFSIGVRKNRPTPQTQRDKITTLKCHPPFQLHLLQYSMSNIQEASIA